MQPLAGYQLRQLVAIFLRQLQTSLHDSRQIRQVAATDGVHVVVDGIFRRQLAARNNTTSTEVFFCVHHCTDWRQVVETCRDNSTSSLDSCYSPLVCTLHFNIDACCKFICTLSTTASPATYPTVRVKLLQCQHTQFWLLRKSNEAKDNIAACPQQWSIIPLQVTLAYRAVKCSFFNYQLFLNGTIRQALERI